MQGKKGSKRIEMIIKMVTEFKLTVVHFASPNPMQICACAWIYRWAKNCGKCGSGRRAAGPLRAVGRGPLGLRAARPLSRRGPWAVDLWAAGLLLAKPHQAHTDLREKGQHMDSCIYEPLLLYKCCDYTL